LSSVKPFGRTVHTRDCFAILCLLIRKGFAVLHPGWLIGDQVNEFGIGIRSSKFAAAFDRYIETEKQDFDLDRQGSFAPWDFFSFVGQLRVKVSDAKSIEQDSSPCKRT
jgi:hypothetical protein